MSVNRVILVGKLDGDPERRSLNDGGTVVNFTLITSQQWQDKASGEQRRSEERHRVAIFNEALGRIATQYLRKGAEIYLWWDAENPEMGRRCGYPA